MEYATKIVQLVDNISLDRNHYRLFEQLESSAASVAQNIAEGKGRYSKKEFIQFLYISRGSLYESITLINLFAKFNWISQENLVKLESEAMEITKMLSSLIQSIRKTL